MAVDKIKRYLITRERSRVIDFLIICVTMTYLIIREIGRVIDFPIICVTMIYLFKRKDVKLWIV